MLNLRECNRKSMEIKSSMGNNLLGLGVYDAMVRDMVDPDTGEVYPALSCCNNQEMADRCTVRGAERAIWAIKGSSALNSECAVLLREGFRSGKIRLLVTEYDGENLLGDIKGYSALSVADRVKLQMPYINTTMLVNELVTVKEESKPVRFYQRILGQLTQKGGKL